MILFLDLETYSTTPIKYGTYVYAEAAEILLLAYAVDDGPVNVWDMTDGSPMPEDLTHALQSDCIIVAHNSMFDRTVLRLATNSTPLLRQAGAAIERWHDTLVRGLAHSLPGGLAKLSNILRLSDEEKKLDTGTNLMRLFCIPPAKNVKRSRATRDTHPEEWVQFIEYATHDVLAMRVLYKKLPKWNYPDAEIDLWHLDQRINDRGFAIDMELVNGAIAAVKEEQRHLRYRTQEMTDYDREARRGIESTTQRDKFLEYILQDYAIALPDLTKTTLERLKDDPDIPAPLQALLSVRLQASTSSTSKYQSLAKGVTTDGRLHGTLQFCGAARTGRWAGRLFQPQNLPRPDIEAAQVEEGIAAIKEGAAGLVFDNVMKLCSNALRGVIVAEPGNKLIASDLSNIEGRFAAWLAGEEWKLEKFRQYDQGKGADLYIVAYAKAFQVPESSINKKTMEGTLKRQIGKVMELMLQYGGGVGAFITGAATYRIDLEEMAAAALPAIPSDVLLEAKEFYGWTIKNKRSTYGLPEHVFIACDALKRLWRRAHPAISSYWKELENVVKESIDTPGEWFHARRVRVHNLKGWLRIQLPSGRFLCYPHPRIDKEGKIGYHGVSTYTRGWGKQSTYGGKLFENITQAGSRDVLAHGMVLAERNDYPIVLDIHDELIVETPDDPRFSVDTLSALMSTPPPWAPELPLASAGFEAYRYKKEL